MPRGAALSEGSSGEYISHFASIRIRVTGGGQLRMYIFSLDDIKYKTLVPFTMVRWNRIIPSRIVNFKSQRACFEIKIASINEYFRIHRIIIFTKATDTSYPGN